MGRGAVLGVAAYQKWCIRNACFKCSLSWRTSHRFKTAWHRLLAASMSIAPQAAIREHLDCSRGHAQGHGTVLPDPVLQVRRSLPAAAAAQVQTTPEGLYDGVPTSQRAGCTNKQECVGLALSSQSSLSRVEHVLAVPRKCKVLSKSSVCVRSLLHYRLYFLLHSSSQLVTVLEHSIY